MNIGIFSYDEIVYIISDERHYDYNYIYSWFGDISNYDLKENKELIWSEYGNELKPNQYWIVDYKTDTAKVVNNLNGLESKIGDLLKYAKENK